MIGLFDFPYAPTSEETARWLELNLRIFFCRLKDKLI
jgi:hypothetical protein